MVRFKRLFNRKDAQFSHMTDIVLVVVVAIVLIVATIWVYNYFGAKSQTEICKSSVAMQATTKLGLTPQGLKSPFYIECEKRYVQITNNEVKVGYSPEKIDAVPVYYQGKNIQKFDNLNEDITDQVFAEELRSCFYQFGEAKVDVFDNSIWGDNNVCFVCSEIEFKNLPGRYLFSNGLIEYLNRTRIPNEKMTYFDYLNQPSVSKKSWWEFASSINNGGNIHIDTNERYAVLFTKQYKMLKTNNYYSYVVPAEDINLYCDQEAT